MTALSRQHCTRKNAAFAEQPRWSASDIFGYDWVARASRVQCQSDSDFRRLAKTNFQLLLLIPASAVNDAEGSRTKNGKILSRNDGLQKPSAQLAVEQRLSSSSD
ncbi:MAG: hypothetical protein DME32_14795 [Verrucomicrobia bacterium]|nr:MAG: hypothetical protein DME32_14795 [Verrucomicrobiota bacterium]